MTDLNVQLFNLLGISQRLVKLYGVTFGQKNALKCYHYGYSICQNILKSEWEKIKRNDTLMELPVNIRFIPFGETPDSEIPTEEMTLRSFSGMPEWGGRYTTNLITVIFLVTSPSPPHPSYNFRHFRGLLEGGDGRLLI